MSLDWQAVRAGAVVAVVICLPISIVGTIVVDTDADDPSALAALFYVAVLAGFAVAGWFAARRAEDTPYTSGALGAMLGFVVIALVSMVANVLRDDDVRVVVLVANAFLAYGSGLLGAAVVARRRTA